MKKMILLMMSMLLLAVSCGSGSDPVCGDGIVEGDEACEAGTEQYCSEHGEFIGTTVCNDTCTGWDMSGCTELVNECETDNGGCGDPAYATCEDTDEAFVCSCAEPYVPTSDGLLCAPRVDRSGETYLGDALIVVNTREYPDYTAYSGTLSGQTVDRRRSESRGVNVENEFPFTVPGLVIPLPDHVTPDMRLRDGEVDAPEISVGDTREFKKVNYSTYQYDTIEATAQYVGEECIIWSDDVETIDESTAQTLGASFDSDIYPLITEHFYTPSDVDGNGRIFIFFSDLGGSAGGYFNPMDVYDGANSNKADIIYIEKLLTRYGTGYTLPVLAHEFQHLVHNNRNALEEGGNINETWITEGFSTSAEHDYAGFRESWLSAFNDSDALSNGTSLFDFDYRSNSDVGASYAQSYMFHQYLRIQAGQGFGIFRELIMHENNKTGAYSAVAAKYIDEDVDFSELLTRFRIAVLLKSETGPYGFLEEDEFRRLSVPWFDGGGTDLGGGSVLYAGIDGSFSDPGDSEEYISYIGVFTGDTAPLTKDEYLDSGDIHLYSELSGGTMVLHEE